MPSWGCYYQSHHTYEGPAGKDLGSSKFQSAKGLIQHRDAVCVGAGGCGADRSTGIGLTSCLGWSETPFMFPEHSIRVIMPWCLGCTSSFPLEEAVSSPNPLSSLGSLVFSTTGSFGFIPRLCAMMCCLLIAKFLLERYLCSIMKEG